MVAGMNRWTGGTLTLEDLGTGDPLFDGEWFFGTFQMAAMGYGQSALIGALDPEEALHRMEECFVLLRSHEVRAFDANSWSTDPLDDLHVDKDHHVAYLGYYNLAMSLARELQRRYPEAKGLSAETLALNDNITQALARRFRGSSSLLLMTYPSQYYAVDNAAAIASVGLYAKALQTDAFDAVLADWELQCRKNLLDHETGLLYQAVTGKGAPIDRARASGSALAAYFLAWSHPKLAAELAESCFALGDTFWGFGVVREYAPGIEGSGDIDSGPIIFGYGVTATGISIGNARIHGREDLFRGLVSTAVLAGAPARGKGEWHWASGGSIGDAILFAMFTAPSREQIRGDRFP
jgi:hypothetical protein